MTQTLLANNLPEKGDVAPEQSGLQPHGLLQRMESCDERTFNTVASLMTVEGFAAIPRAEIWWTLDRGRWESHRMNYLD